MRASRRGLLGGVAVIGAMVVGGTVARAGGVPPVPPVAGPIVSGPVVMEGAMPMTGGAALPCYGDDPFCGCAQAHPCSGPDNGFSNQRLQHMRKLGLKLRHNKVYCGSTGVDPWLMRYQGGGVATFPTGPTVLGP